MNEYIIYLSLNQKNFFKILDLREKFELSESLIKQKFEEKQMKIKENQILLGDDFLAEYEELAEAYYNIIDPILRAKHILDINGVTKLDPNVIINITRLVSEEFSHETQEKFENYFEQMRECFKSKDLFGAYEAWYSCSILNNVLNSKNP